ncbi:MAG: xanthine dehydrogenase family protein subunit M [Ectothiorhodospiraceae bacterium]|nr:xanthine dehydrogenase family protein subunit M [Ectothiorhodospiraceae bacterium]
MKAPAFDYARPETLEEVHALLAEHGDDARILAGGQSLMPTLALRLSGPALLVDVNRIPGLGAIEARGDGLQIGALARHAAVLASPLVAARAPVLTRALPHVGHVAIRSRGTFGGSIALADPAAEIPACALALEAEVVLEGADGSRVVPAADFFLGLYETAREPDEVVTAVRLPSQAGRRFGFAELARRHGDFALAGIAASARLDHDDRVTELRLVCFGCADRAVLADSAAARALGRRLDAATIAEVAAGLGADVEPIPSPEADAETRLHWARVLTARVLGALPTTPEVDA